MRQGTARLRGGEGAAAAALERRRGCRGRSRKAFTLSEAAGPLFGGEFYLYIYSGDIVLSAFRDLEKVEEAPGALSQSCRLS